MLTDSTSTLIRLCVRPAVDGGVYFVEMGHLCASPAEGELTSGACVGICDCGGI